MVIPQWRRVLFETMTEKLFSELSTMTETELRDLRNELSIYETSHAFNRETTRKAIRLYIDLIATLFFRT